MCVGIKLELDASLILFEGRHQIAITFLPAIEKKQLRFAHSGHPLKFKSSHGNRAVVLYFSYLLF